MVLAVWFVFMPMHYLYARARYGPVSLLPTRNEVSIAGGNYNGSESRSNASGLLKPGSGPS